MKLSKFVILAFADRALAQSFVEIVWSTKTECVGVADSLVSCFSHSYPPNFGRVMIANIQNLNTFNSGNHNRDANSSSCLFS
jgi:hypothetical protein